jgi:hypothetical protein
MTDTELFKQKFEQWREYLGNNNNADANSITQLFFTLYKEMGAYEAYVAICQSNHSSPLATLLFGNLTAFNYIQIQALRIRRLCDKSAVRKNKDVSVYSLRRIVDEMKQERDAGRFTKDNVCEAFNIPKTKAEIEAQFLADTSNISGSFATGSITAGNIHAMLDGIFDINNLIKQEIIDELENRLDKDKNDKLKTVIEFVDKYIAHSSSPDSRNGNDLQLRMSELKEVIGGLTEAFYICLWAIEYNAPTVAYKSWDGYVANLSQDEQKLVSETYENMITELEKLKSNAHKLFGVQ